MEDQHKGPYLFPPLGLEQGVQGEELRVVLRGGEVVSQVDQLDLLAGGAYVQGDPGVSDLLAHVIPGVHAPGG